MLDVLVNCQIFKRLRSLFMGLEFVTYVDALIVKYIDRKKLEI